jgi:hypothetical protein
MFENDGCVILAETDTDLKRLSRGRTHSSSGVVHARTAANQGRPNNSGTAANQGRPKNSTLVLQPTKADLTIRTFLQLQDGKRHKPINIFYQFDPIIYSYIYLLKPLVVCYKGNDMSG